MLAEERRTRLLDLVRNRRFASFPELAEALRVSESTVRRDAESLEEDGSAKRIHGGLLYANSPAKNNHSEDINTTRLQQKQAIAQLAQELIEDRDTILLDGGSTTYELARRLAGRSLHIVTNCLPVANLFAADAGSDLVLIGGNICPRTGVARGPYADRMLATVRVRKTILSVAAIHQDGFFNNNLLLAETERAMMKAADEVIVVADSSKFGHQSLTHLCPLNAVDYLVTDDGMSETWRNAVRAAGVKLLVAPVEHQESFVGTVTS